MTIDVLPNKHTRTSESLVGLGGILLSIINESPKSLDEVISELKENEYVSARFHGSIPMDAVLLTLDFLFTIGGIRLNRDGLVEK